MQVRVRRARRIRARDIMSAVPHRDVLLRPWRLSDAAALRDAYLSTPDLTAQFGDARLTTEASAAEFIEANLPDRESIRNWAMVRGDTAIGNVGLSAIEHRHDTAWAYYWVAAAARGDGLATRALITAARWAFGEGIFRIELGHRVNNPASCRVAEKAGFISEGIERHKLKYGDERFDVELHARLTSDPDPVIAGLEFAASDLA